MKNKKKILVILGHPLTESFNGALFNAYVAGAKKAGLDVRAIELGKLKFEPVLRYAYKKRMKVEEDLQRAIDDVAWADHVVLVYPYWWGSCPALLQGFFERTFTPGFAFKFLSDWRWKGLLKGKTARLIVSMDAPPLFDHIYWRSAGIRTIKFNILEFCGIKPVRVTRIGPVKSSDESKREKWLQQVEELGRRGE